MLAREGGVVFASQYRAGTRGQACTTGQGTNIMHQWASQTCALQGHNYSYMLGIYYPHITLGTTT
ncbi:hypothetical protein [Fodinicola feengrottensis]|uniref:hypothetical protein n=1 Tax=Fodinicola feengrottensis TaxID=435914 RepID=UPI0013D1869B|nr:hypothetical protein [Fodinicola feengrottensis]